MVSLGYNVVNDMNTRVLQNNHRQALSECIIMHSLNLYYGYYIMMFYHTFKAHLLFNDPAIFSIIVH